MYENDDRTIGDIWHEKAVNEPLAASLATFGACIGGVLLSVALLQPLAYGEDTVTSDDAQVTPVVTVSEDRIPVVSDIVSDEYSNLEKAERMLSKMGTIAAKGSKAVKVSIKASKNVKLVRAEKQLDKAIRYLDKAKVKRKAIRKLKVGEQYNRKADRMVSKLSSKIDDCTDIFDEAVELKELNDYYERNANSLRHNGTMDRGGWHYTYYSQKVLPGWGLDIPGRHVGLADMVMDKHGYVCVASSSLSKGTVLETPFGMAKVYDTGCPYGTIDVYTNW